MRGSFCASRCWLYWRVKLLITSRAPSTPPSMSSSSGAASFGDATRHAAASLATDAFETGAPTSRACRYCSRACGKKAPPATAKACTAADWIAMPWRRAKSATLSARGSSPARAQQRKAAVEVGGALARAQHRHREHAQLRLRRLVPPPVERKRAVELARRAARSDQVALHTPVRRRQQRADHVRRAVRIDARELHALVAKLLGAVGQPSDGASPRRRREQDEAVGLPGRARVIDHGQRSSDTLVGVELVVNVQHRRRERRQLVRAHRQLALPQVGVERPREVAVAANVLDRLLHERRVWQCGCLLLRAANRAEATLHSVDDPPSGAAAVLRALLLR